MSVFRVRIQGLGVGFGLRAMASFRRFLLAHISFVILRCWLRFGLLDC